MKTKTYQGNQETKTRILNAIQELSKIVAVTLGPGGRPILIERENAPPLTTKDGVTVSRHFKADGNIERVVADAAREVCERTVKLAGDGTTTAIVLAAALVEHGQIFLANNKNYSPQRLSRELKNIFQTEIRRDVLGYAKSIKNLPIEKSREVVRHVALVSSNHDEEIASAVVEALEEVGEDGMIIAEEGAGADTKVEPAKGFPFTTGLSDLGGVAAQAFVNRQDYGDCVAEGAYVCLYDGDINDVATVTPVLERIASEIGEDGRPVKSPVMVFAHRFADNVLKMMAQNFRRGVLTVIPAITPRNGQNDGRSQFLHDLAAYVGGKVFDSQGHTLQEAHLPQLGFAESVKIGRGQGVILGAPEQSAVESRISELKVRMEGASEFDQDLLRYRIGRLTGGVATIYAGGSTALEARERHARVVDAISAVRSAMELGVVPGGGATLAELAFNYSVYAISDPRSIFANALKTPFLQILDNAGADRSDAMVGVGPCDMDGEGSLEFIVYDALKRKLVEWYSGGIIDPAKVTLTALDNAISVAQLLMTLGGVIAHELTEGDVQVKAMQEGVLKAIEQEALGG